MGVLDDVRRWLRKIPIWRERENVLKRRFDALEKRVATLEAELTQRPIPEKCPQCQSELKIEHVEHHWSGIAEFHHLVCPTPGCRFAGRTKRVEFNK